MAYAMGFALYAHERRRAGDFLEDSQRSWIIVAAVLGAALGSAALVGFQGKTVVGGLLGGTMAVEWTKRRLGIERRTGDLFAIPIAAAMAVGRVGCLLDGLADHTYGIETRLPWGWDFGDGVRRHPTQLYEIAFLLGVVAVLAGMRRNGHREGARFRLFLVSYLAFRFAVDFLKPDPKWWGLSSIQWASAATICWYARDLSWLTASGLISSTTSLSPSAPPAIEGSTGKSSSRTTGSTS